MKTSGLIRRLTVPVSLGGVCAGFVAGVALQLQQATLWSVAGYGVVLALALATVMSVGLVCRPGQRRLHGRGRQRGVVPGSGQGKDPHTE